MKIQTFQDGDRFVVVFEGLSEKTAEQEMIKGLLQGLAGVMTTMAPPADATPVAKEEDHTDVLNMIEEVADATFQDGPYTGKTPKEVSEEFGSKGFIYLAEQKDIVSGALRDACIQAMREVTETFRSCDAKGYAGKLTEGQIHTFFRKFQALLPADLRARIGKDGTDNRALVEEAIAYLPDAI